MLRQIPRTSNGPGCVVIRSHNELHTWDSATFTPVDNKKHEYVISDAVYGSEDVDHIIIKIDAFENGSWKTKGTVVEYRPADCTSDFPPI